MFEIVSLLETKNVFWWLKGSHKNNNNNANKSNNARTTETMQLQTNNNPLSSHKAHKIKTPEIQLQTITIQQQ
jgi:hypothetical protein